MTTNELKTAKWNDIKGRDLGGVTREWRMKEVEIEDAYYSTAVVVECRGGNRRVITDPAKKSQAKHNGFA